jgi:hypothetical protein
MPRLRENQAPSYRCHKQSGQAIVTFNGRDILLGHYGSEESRAKYDRLVAEWFQSGRQLSSDDPKGPTVADVIAAFWDYAERYDRHPDGTLTSEVDNLRQALRPLRRLYGDTPAAAFGPKSLKAVREVMIQTGWARTNINRQVNRLRHVFSWATQEELIPPFVYHGLQTVSGLRIGRSDAKETAPVAPVAEAHVRAVLPHVSSVVAARFAAHRRNINT